MQERLFANPKIEVVWDSVVEEVLGGGEPAGVTGVRIRNVKTQRRARAQGRRPVRRHRP